MSSSLTEGVLEHLRSRGPSKASEIADGLGVDRSLVNRELYGALRGKVRQSKDYRWSLNDGLARARDRSEVINNSHERLFMYYLECISQDDNSGVGVFADSRFGLDYTEIGGWPLDESTSFLATEPVRRLVDRQRREPRKKTLWLGYPVSLRHARSRKGWEGAFLEPILIWPQDAESNEPSFLPEPIVNHRALKNLGTAANVMEDAAQLADELGLDAGEHPSLDELAARLRDLRSDWDWKDDLAPSPFRGPGELREFSDDGIYNAAIVLIAERSPFTIGLERELADLTAVSDAAIDSSVLGKILGFAGAPISLEGPILEPVPLNAEQRSAVNFALTQPLTVITGPPGTGKSQVVTAMLVNAAWRGLRVLFASKNNKAVDVVQERVNALSPRPIMLRLGTRDLQEQLAQQLTAILSAHPTDDDRIAHKTALATLAAESDALDALAEEMNAVVRLRNRVDGLERAAQAARQALPRGTFCYVAESTISEADQLLSAAREALRQFDRTNAPFFTRLFWGFVESSRREAVLSAAQALSAALEPFGFQSDTDSPVDESVISNASMFIEDLRAARAYSTALTELSKMPDLGAIAAEYSVQSRTLADVSGEVWRSWTALLPDRLNEAERASLGDYAAILRTISRSDEEGGSIAREVWRRYYALAAKTTKALPCWAVTSLSARGRVPFTPAEFDLVIIDEASQCDIASAIPLLFRAKRAAVIGDPQQLRHISGLSEQRDQAMMVKHGVLDDPGPSWSYKANSLFDLAAARVASDSIVVLRDHHRSHADIIAFSNEFFYGGRLRVATDYRRLIRPRGPAIRWVNVRGKVVRPRTGGAINEAEATAVVEELRRIAISQRFIGEIGVVTPFRAQANLIEELITRDESLALVLASRNFISETAHRFQGDERDLIVFSPVVSDDTSDNALSFLRHHGNIFNVGITRARGALIVVGDAAACAGSDVNYLSRFARYVTELDNKERVVEPRHTTRRKPTKAYPAVARPELVSDWEKLLYSALVETGLCPVPQFEVDQYILDLALILPNGRCLDIEVDGEHYHRDWDGELLRRDLLRNLRLIEMGWDILRLWVYEVRDNITDCVAQVRGWVEEADALPTVVNDPSLM